MKDLLRFIAANPVHASVLFVSTLVAFSITFDEDLDLNGDNTNYYMLGKALCLGKGYTNIDGIIEVPATNFPPGYPALVAVVMTLFSDEIVTVKTANGILFALAILLLFYLFHRLSGNPHLAFVAGICTALNGHLLRYSTIIMSEIPFLLFTTAALVLFLHARSSSLAGLLKNSHLYLFFFVLVFSFHIRTTGIALMGGVLLVLLLRRDWKYALLVCGVFILAMLPWNLRASRLGGNSYLSQFVLVNPYRPEQGNIGVGDLVVRLINNAIRYVNIEIPNGCFSFLRYDYSHLDVVDPLQFALGAAAVLIMGLGAHSIQHHRDLIAGYLLATFAILFCWPVVWIGIRFLAPVIPLLIFCFFNGLWRILHLLSDRFFPQFRPRAFLLLPLALPLMGDLPRLHHAAAGAYPPGWQNYFEMARWVRHNLPRDAVVCCRKSSIFYMFADRHVTRYDFIADTEEFIEHLKRKRVTHVVVDNLGFSSTRLYLNPAVQKHQDLFTVLHWLENPSTVLLEFDPKGVP